MIAKIQPYIDNEDFQPAAIFKVCTHIHMVLYFAFLYGIVLVIFVAAVTGIKSLYVNLSVGQGHAQVPLCGQERGSQEGMLHIYIQ